MAKTVLIVGGARSGKSRFAQQLASKLAGDDVLFVATAEASDEEMRRRIDRHRRDRPPEWKTVEAKCGVAAVLEDGNATCRAVVVDCLTLLVSNLLLADEGSPVAAEDQVDREIAALLHTCNNRPCTVIIVSGEVGMGIVPDNELARRFRDVLGRANQQIAEQADAVYLMCAGFAIDVGQHATSLAQAASRLQARRTDQTAGDHIQPRGDHG